MLNEPSMGTSSVDGRPSGEDGSPRNTVDVGGANISESNKNDVPS